MHKNILFAMTTLVTVVTMISFCNSALAAKKKLTYEEAYAKCKAFLDKEGTPGTSTHANVRYTRGAACMKKYGYKL